MTQPAAGWYPDPDPNGAPGSQRFWDGNAWTSRVQAPAAPMPPPPVSSPGWPPSPHGVSDPYAPSQPNPYAEQPLPPGQQIPYAQQHPGAPRVPTTPDGQRLAGWGVRLLAYLIDMVILIPINLALGWPFWRDIFSAYTAYLDQVLGAAESGATPPSSLEFLADVFVPLAATAAISFVVIAVYQCGMLKWKQATLGKLMLGLQVRLRDQPGPLSWGTVIKRWIAQNWASIVALVPILGTIASIYPWLDGLWPLWDSKRQALHDKFADTNVVHTR